MNEVFLFVRIENTYYLNFFVGSSGGNLFIPPPVSPPPPPLHLTNVDKTDKLKNNKFASDGT
jgi:hypothetical protein